MLMLLGLHVAAIAIGFGIFFKKFGKLTRKQWKDTFNAQTLVIQPRKVNMDLLTFIAWIIIFVVFWIFTLLAIKFLTFRIILAIIFALPILFTILFFAFRIPVLTNDSNKIAFFENWKVGGHRGSSHDGIPENSLEAFLAVKNEGGQLAEMDIQITSDGVAVICHDSNVERVTGIDQDISSMTEAEFKNLTFIGTNISLPTFAEAVAFCVKNDLMMIWDVKNVDENLLKQFVIQIRTHNLYSKVIIAGFNPIDTYMVKLADSKILTGFTWRSWELSTTDEEATKQRFSGVLNAIANVLDIIAYCLARSLVLPKFLGSDMIFYHVNDASKYLAKSATDNNMYLAGWTSNNKTEMRWLRDYLKIPFLTDNVSMVPKN
ncbi:unnamed protein product [Caenorhabditis angaria]|uniref:GP-PDE domain-containing protein n=1 Tax=Caenorhabditis angaria TaxID=860376 RepID=A0A9P1IJK1_9PELO|nr:unnamed protein product [Caenorhabditis angaria]